MAFAILGNPKPQFFDSSGAPLAGGTLTIVEPSTDVNKATYPTYDEAEVPENPNANPITLDARGECDLWGLDGEDYKLTLKDANGDTVWTTDDVFLPGRVTAITAAESAAGVTPTKLWYEPGNVLRYGADTTGATDSTTEIQNAIAVASIGTHGVWIPAGTYLISSLDLEDFAGAAFIGEGKSTTKFSITGTVSKAIIVNSGSGGSSGSVNNRRIGGFRVDCTSATVTTGVYCDQYTRGELFDIEVVSAATGFRFGYGWITKLSRLTSTNHTVNGFLFESTSVNAIICEGLSATTTTATAINYKVAANSITFYSPTSEGTPLEGFQIADGCRSILIIQPHVEGANCGVFSDLTNTNSGALSVREGIFFDCDAVLTMRQKCSHLTFVGNILQNSTIGDISVEINADSFEVYGNHIEGGTNLQKVAMYSFDSINNIDMVRFSEASRRVHFNSVDFDYYDRSVTTATSATDVETYRDVTAGSAGEFEIIQRLSANNTSIERLLWRVAEDDTFGSSSIGGVGSTLVTALGYNSTTNRLTLDAAFAGTASLKIKCWNDSQ